MSEKQPHLVVCNYSNGPIGASGCICVVVNRNELVLLKQATMQLGDFYNQVTGVMSESRGVDGFHRNGDVADWEEFDFPTPDPEVLELIKKQGEQPSASDVLSGKVPDPCVLCGKDVVTGPEELKWGLEWEGGRWVHYRCAESVGAAALRIQGKEKADG